MNGFCDRCGHEKTRKDGYCSTTCFNLATKETPISGWRPCIYCGIKFPFKNTAISRGTYCKRLGRFIGKRDQKFCSKPCSLRHRNKHQNPSKNQRVRKLLSDNCRKRFAGTKHTKEAIEKRRQTISGDGHWNWQGGKTSESRRLRNQKELRDWRISIYIRDNYTCQLCGKRGGKLNADHIKPWSLYPELRFDLGNGRTLCWDCHKQTPTFMGRIHTYKRAIAQI